MRVTIKAYILAKTLDRSAAGFFSALSKDRELSAVSASLKALPKNAVLVPKKQYSFLSQENPNRKPDGHILPYGWLKVLGTFAATALVVLMVWTAYDQALGLRNSLSTWKLEAQRASLVLNPSPQAKTEYNLRLTERRLEEATIAFADPGVTEEKRLKVLNALADQTQKTVDSLTVNNQALESRQEILSKLSAVVSQQLDILQKQSGDAGEGAAHEALLSAEAGAKTAQVTLLMIAASSEQDLASLGVVTLEEEGVVESFKDGYLSLEGLSSEIYISPTTEFVGKDFTQELLKPGLQVKVLADFTAAKTSALAKSVTLVADLKVLQTAPVKQDAVQQVEPMPGEMDSDTLPPEEKKVEVQPGTVSTGFRIEDPVVPIQ